MLSQKLYEREGTLLFLKWTNFGIDWVLWFFPLLVLNHFLYLLFRRKVFFLRYKIIVITAFVALELFFFLPYICSARETAGPPAKNEPSDPFVEKLKEVDRLLQMSPAERNIYVLEHTQEKSLVLEKVDIQDPFLIFSSQPVEIRSPNFYFTLAALYRHLGKEEMVVENLKILDLLPLEHRWLSQYAFIYPKLLREYLKNNRMVEATSIAKKLIEVYGEQRNVEELIALSTFLTEKEMITSAGEAVKEACAVAYSTEQVLSLAQYLLKNRRNSELASVLKQGLERTRKFQAVVSLLRFCIENNLTEETSLAVIQAIKASTSVQEDLALARLLYEMGRKEEAANILEQAREKSVKLSLLMEISRTAREQGFLSIAIRCVERAILTNREEALNYQLPSPHLLDADKFLPSREPVSLPTYLGILQQVDKKLEKADLSYKLALTKELEAILRSYGRRITGNINEFYYLKQLWEELHPKDLEFLLPIYVRLQENILQQEKTQERKEVGILQAKVEQLKRQRSEILKERAFVESRLSRAALGIGLYSLRDLAVVLAILAILAGCVIKGIHSAKSVTNFKFFAFFWKFLESVGWSASFSVVGIVFGIPLVVGFPTATHDSIHPEKVGRSLFMKTSNPTSDRQFKKQMPEGTFSDISLFFISFCFCSCKTPGGNDVGRKDLNGSVYEDTYYRPSTSMVKAVTTVLKKNHISYTFSAIPEGVIETETMGRIEVKGLIPVKRASHWSRRIQNPIRYINAFLMSWTGCWQGYPPFLPAFRRPTVRRILCGQRWFFNLQKTWLFRHDPEAVRIFGVSLT